MMTESSGMFFMIPTGRCYWCLVNEGQRCGQIVYNTQDEYLPSFLNKYSSFLKCSYCWDEKLSSKSLGWDLILNLHVRRPRTSLQSSSKGTPWRWQGHFEKRPQDSLERTREGQLYWLLGVHCCGCLTRSNLRGNVYLGTQCVVCAGYFLSTRHKPRPAQKWESQLKNSSIKLASVGHFLDC